MTAPDRVRLRMYQVGFGDCFLLTFEYPRDLGDGRRERNVLVDFGTTSLVKGTDLTDIAKLIGEHSKGKLDAIVVSHRHQDHLSGFGSDRTVKILGPMTETLELVVQPWTEDPAARANATGAGKKFFDSVDRIEELAGEITSRIDPGVKDVRRGLRSAAKAQLSNKEAVDQLKKWGKTYGAEYLSVGRPTRLSEEVLPGVKVTVLGPPTIDQEPDIQSYADEDANYWIGRPNTLPFGGATPAGLPPADPDLAKRLLESPAQVRWLIDRIDRQAAWNVRRIVRRMDDFLNNTSLILMFETGDRRLLFPGDAQIENWEYALTKAANSEDVRKKLASVDLYKVGHHGSRNATPKRLLYEPWRKKLNGHRMTSVVSTKEGKHGSTEETAVPRATLLEGLCHLGDVWGTHELKKAPFLEVWAPTEGAAGFQRAEA